MRIIDARSGEELTVGQRIERNKLGEFVELLEVREQNPFRAMAKIRHAYVDLRHVWDINLAPIIEEVVWVPVTVRFLHPKFLFQRVGFLPS